ncbi:hypothetical protein GOODEAATRI_017054, partial [Goodea atripinnis]
LTSRLPCGIASRPRQRSPTSCKPATGIVEAGATPGDGAFSVCSPAQIPPDPNGAPAFVFTAAHLDWELITLCVGRKMECKCPELHQKAGFPLKFSVGGRDTLHMDHCRSGPLHRRKDMFSGKGVGAQS